MSKVKEVVVSTNRGDSIKVQMLAEEGRDVATLIIDNNQYHFERIKGEELIAKYRVDTDPDYAPQSDTDGYCYILVPYAK
jgi:hypothetical protein